MVQVNLFFTILVCFGIPLGGQILLSRKKKGLWKLFLMGAAAFFISQICIRIPLLNFVLPNFKWFQTLPYYPWAYGLFLGATAALFEEGARYLAIKLYLRKKTAAPDRGGVTDGISFGLGHGGIEAILLAGINSIVLLSMVFINPELIRQAGSISGMSQLEQSVAAVLQQDPVLFVVAGLERLFAMMFHAGASIIVMHGIRYKTGLRNLGLAFALHTIIDAAIIILPAILGIGVLGLELWCAIMGFATLVIGILLYKKTEKG